MTRPSEPRMHEITDETRAIVDLILDYSRARLLAEDTPLDKPLPPAELSRLAGRTIDERGIGATKALGIFEQTGSLKAGKNADVVLWNGNPFSTYTRPERVWVDGALMYDANNPKLRPVSDFELGQPGEGDVK